MSEPTAMEIVRRLDDIARRLDQTVHTLEEGYVRKDLYQANRTADDRRMDETERDLATAENARRDKDKADAAFRRQAALGFALAGIGWLVTMALAITTYIGR